MKVVVGPARRVLPEPLFELGRRHFGEWARSLRLQQRLADAVVRDYGTDVAAGPFAGLHYVGEAADRCVVPKLLGCYEEELFPTVEAAIATGYERVIDVGCASGWYVAGLARALPAATVFGFDTDERALERCRRIVALNSVSERVSLGGFCTPMLLNELIGGRTLVVCDIEGGEVELLRPDRAPNLRHADLLVELHDPPGDSTISDAVLPRFAASHDVELVSSRTRTPSLERYPHLDALPPDDWSAAVDERRGGPMRWAVMSARVPAASA